MSISRAAKRPAGLRDEEGDEAMLLDELEAEVGGRKTTTHTHFPPSSSSSSFTSSPSPSSHRKRRYPLCILAFLAFFALLVLSPSTRPSTATATAAVREKFEAVKSRFRPVEEVALPSMGEEEGGRLGAQEGTGRKRDVCATEHGCRFLVPTTIGEQESRAHFHLLQLSSLATYLNRTLILPRAYTSRFSTCGTHSFDYFYSPSSFANTTSALIGPEAASITQREFERWLANRPGSTGAQAVRLAIPMHSAGDPETANATYGRFVPDQEPYGGEPLMPCLDGQKLDFRGRAPVVRFEPWRFYGQKVVEDLKVLDEQEGAAVMLVHYNLRGPLFAKVEREAVRTGAIEEAFEYREEWEELARRMLDLPEVRGKAVAGVHWRTETLRAERLRMCGESLHGVLGRLRERQPDVGAVYLASDFPIESLEGAPSRLAGASGEEAESGVLAHSDTLSNLLTPEHFAAMSSFLQAFAPASSSSPAVDSSSTDLTLHTFSSPRPSLLASLRTDPSLSPSSRNNLLRYASSPPARSILDNLILQRVEVFLAGFSVGGGPEAWDRAEKAGGRKVCGKRSNWTMRVGRGREGRWKAQVQGEKIGKEGEEKEWEGRKLRNVVGTWSAEGKVDRVPGLQR